MRRTRVRSLRLLAHAMLVGVGLLGLMGLAGIGGSLLVQPAEAQGTAPIVKVVTAAGVINPTLAHFVTRAIDQAEQDGAQVMVLQLDTPGGLDTSMRQIIQRIL